VSTERVTLRLRRVLEEKDDAMVNALIAIRDEKPREAIQEILSVLGPRALAEARALLPLELRRAPELKT
jgi:hypothetical protein